MSGKKTCEIDTDAWQCAGPYEFVHSVGWTITNEILRAKLVWLLRQVAAEHGNLKSADEATRRYAELSGVPPVQT
jgi:hypothetical protein